ncbi:hypothetical protein XFEB_00100 [Xylella fastidiosa EB92.1]|nr:hypothetical protein XFEB_00100 [Xylella fastidiosa EB92.1]
MTVLQESIHNQYGMRCVLMGRFPTVDKIDLRFCLLMWSLSDCTHLRYVRSSFWCVMECMVCWADYESYVYDGWFNL